MELSKRDDFAKHSIPHLQKCIERTSAAPPRSQTSFSPHTFHWGPHHDTDWCPSVYHCNTQWPYASQIASCQSILSCLWCSNVVFITPAPIAPHGSTSIPSKLSLISNPLDILNHTEYKSCCDWVNTESSRGCSHKCDFKCSWNAWRHGMVLTSRLVTALKFGF